ncbi:MAG: hypothetical protein HY248_02120 [Fimbriimonas ginsengisoli]|nr:hypothetical protein [Fimbriimonas ginsengisoli]
MLLIELPADAHAKLVAAGSGAMAAIDLVEQRVAVGGEEISFDIPGATKEALLGGLDLIGTTLIQEQDIADYEKADTRFVPLGG